MWHVLEIMNALEGAGATTNAKLVSKQLPPLESETARIWRAGRFRGVQTLTTTYTSHTIPLWLSGIDAGISQR